MREILFRGKRLDNGEWVEGYYVEKKDPLLESDVRNAFILAQARGDSFVTWFPVDPAAVGQFTGLRNKNGERIFEGDIAKIKGQGVYLCVWSKGNLEFSLTNVKESFGIAYLPMYNATVIGTIHDIERKCLPSRLNTKSTWWDMSLSGQTPLSASLTNTCSPMSPTGCHFRVRLERRVSD